jgi:hypothetical protein
MKRKPRESPTTVHQLVDCINRRYLQHRSKIINEDIAFGDWLLAQKEKVRTQGDLWGRVFKDRRIECSQATAERYMSIAKNSVMRNSAHAQIWPRSFYARYLLSTIPESRLHELTRRIHPKLTRDEAEGLRKRAGAASRPRLVFGRSINGGVGCGWRNYPEKVFGGARAIGRKLPPGVRLFTFAERHLRSPADILALILELFTLMPDERHWPGDGQPKKWGLLLRYLIQHEKEEAFLNDLCKRPFEQHEAFIERLMREAYAAHKAEGEAAQTLETETDEAA